MGNASHPPEHFRIMLDVALMDGRNELKLHRSSSYLHSPTFIKPQFFFLGPVLCNGQSFHCVFFEHVSVRAILTPAINLLNTVSPMLIANSLNVGSRLVYHSTRLS